MGDAKVRERYANKVAYARKKRGVKGVPLHLSGMGPDRNNRALEVITCNRAGDRWPPHVCMPQFY
jgi:hypothetical protein